VEDTNGVFEPASAVAFLVYLVVGGIILSLLSVGGAYYGRYHEHYDY